MEVKEKVIYNQTYKLYSYKFINYVSCICRNHSLNWISYVYTNEEFNNILTSIRTVEKGINTFLPAMRHGNRVNSNVYTSYIFFISPGCLWAMNPSKVEKMDEEVQKWSRKDPQAIKKAMVYPGQYFRKSLIAFTDKTPIVLSKYHTNY